MGPTGAKPARKTVYAMAKDQLKPWYAVRTKCNFERVVTDHLRAKQYEPFLPLYSCRRRWSDRVKVVDVPLFPGYVFCRFDVRVKVPIVSVPGVAGIVSFGGQPAPVPDSEIAAIERLIRSSLIASPCPYLQEGMEVRVRSGPLAGVEGRLDKIKSRYVLVLSVHMLQRSVAVEIDAEAVEALR